MKFIENGRQLKRDTPNDLSAPDGAAEVNQKLMRIFIGRRIYF